MSNPSLLGESPCCPQVQADLDIALQELASYARSLTRGTGAAIALSGGGEMVCQATSGTTVPDLGARLDLNAGLSGTSLRLGKTLKCDDAEADPRVDAEVCRKLGVRSVIVVPLRDCQANIGILEVLSPQPGAFTDAHVNALQAIAEAVVKLVDQQAETERRRPAEETPIPSDPALDAACEAEMIRGSFLKLGCALEGRSSHRGNATLVLAIFALLAMGLGLLLAGVPIHDHVAAGNSQTLAPPAITAPQPAAEDSAVNTAKLLPASAQADLAAQAILPASAGEEPPIAEPAATAEMAQSAADTVKNEPVTGPVRLPAPVRVAARHASGTSVQAMAISPGLLGGQTSADVSTLVARLPVAVPELAAPAPLRISQGITQGLLLEKVDPTYPPLARQFRLQGSVVLQALIDKTGAVRNIRVLRGSLLLARAASEAVRQWRYRPYSLNGQPVEVETEITVVFKPSP